MSNVNDEIDELANVLSTGATSLTPNNIASEHPRFAQYKYTNRGEESQERRRREHLQRQKEARFDHANHARKLAMNVFDDDDDDADDNVEDEEMKDDNKNRQAEQSEQDAKKSKAKRKNKRQRNRYAGELMFSEWLVDIPDSLSTDWIIVPCPIGKRCLVVASSGVTTFYTKNGYLIKQCNSYLPGGSRSSCSSFTLLDCILHNELQILYCLDVLAWDGVSVAENEFDCRLFLLNSRIAENQNFQETTTTHPYRFVCLPYCRCEHELMEQMMQREFDFNVDGILFYQASVQYHHGQSPLVGWLKPWMLPEILQVSVPEKYITHEKMMAGDSQAFIDNYNKAHGHKSQFTKEKS